MTVRNEALFWDLAEPHLAEADVERSTMMGHDCLRAQGNFFAMVGSDGALIVKLPSERVAALLDTGAGRVFAPSGRPFREWLAVDQVDEQTWRGLMAEARSFVS